MGKGSWFGAIVKGLGNTGDGFTITEACKSGHDGKKVLSLEFVDPIRNGRFYVDLPDDATDDQITSAVRKGWKQFIRSHPVP